MKSLSFSCLLASLSLLASCSSVELAPADAPPILLAQEETRECGQGQIVFPAGEYKAEVKSESGIYYKAPKRIRTLGVLIGRSEEGGIFVSKGAGNPQAAWFGDPKDNVDESPGTLFGAIGWSAPKLWPYTPRIGYSVKK
ncbi:MAG: hypothetical protein IAE77_06300 [Prosthecobacter sp.]|uniref:hypothetical protein n=1 Tax=Prosthecobacter sp. TaxID=1965333 RepID=UPI001A00AF14|nr:hypothetical protein [Prosthecobacter sp.]MBE2283052.1 hypothetical protein [Prosthecobacter sp.]